MSTAQDAITAILGSTVLAGATATGATVTTLDNIDLGALGTLCP